MTKCKHCSRDFEPYSPHDIYCSPDCRRKAYNSELNELGGLKQPRKINRKFNRYSMGDHVSWYQKSFA